METKTPETDPSIRNFKFALVAAATIAGAGIVGHTVKGWILNDFENASQQHTALSVQAKEIDTTIAIILENPAP